MGARQATFFSTAAHWSRPRSPSSALGWRSVAALASSRSLSWARRCFASPSCSRTPTLSGDVYRYIWDGRVINAGFNPYLHVPADPALTALRDPDQFYLIDKRDYAVTIYPPMAEAIFAIVTLVSTRVWAMKLAMVLFEACAVLAIARLLRRLGRPAGWLVAYLLHPAPIWEIAGNGHVDAAMMAFLFGTLAWGEPNRPYRAATAMTLGALAKPTGALGLPALWRPFQIVLPLFVLGLAVLLYLPFAGAGTRVRRFPAALPRGAGSLKRRGRLLVGPSGQSGTPPANDVGSLCGFSWRSDGRASAVDAAARCDRHYEPAPRNRASAGRLLLADHTNVPLVLSRRPTNGPADRRLESLRARDRRLPSLWVPRRRAVLFRPMGAAYGVRSCGGGS